ncbi:hypothetical protein PbDSM24746_22120 [Paenibacillus macerans]|nr:hypothetical protein PbDSM24746_22120 [Paenibacillus macerans]GBK68519.1 hypothetical protein PbJCM17693_22270 [Paenibacillus macerans]GIP10282.1 hypothetical protein J1TS5_24520 [Paenibacillus macerans]
MAWPDATLAPVRIEKNMMGEQISYENKAHNQVVVNCCRAGGHFQFFDDWESGSGRIRRVLHPAAGSAGMGALCG